MNPLSASWSRLRRVCGVWGAIFFAGSVGAATDAAPAEGPHAPTDLRLFLVLGFPNLPPRGHVEKMDRELHPRVLLMNKGFGWARAIEPADWTASELTVVELAAALGRTVVESWPTVRVGLIPATFGGRSLDDWMPGTALYKAAVERARIAQRDGTLAGILWYQGPTSEDGARSDYAKRFATMIAQLRADLTVNYVPVIVGELNLAADDSARPSRLAEVPQQVIPCLFVSASGLRAENRERRLDSKVLWEFNERFTRAWMDLAQP